MEKSKLDRFLKRWISRKLFLVFVSTGLLVAGLITPEIWGTIASLWVGAQATQDVIENWKHGPNV